MARQAGVSLRIKFEVTTIEGIKESVFQGFGGGFVLQLAIAREVKAGQLIGVRVLSEKLVRDFFIFMRLQATSRLGL